MSKQGISIMGRPKGSRNRYSTIPRSLVDEALARLAVAVGNNEQWAIQETLKRVPVAMPEPMIGGMQEAIMNARINDLVDFDIRLAALESKHDGK
jgi:hypothetical protein|nr:Uncharacterised protein [Raoultella sp. NCTC 9187]